MIFKRTAIERGMWRGWFSSGQSLEVTWPRTPIGVKVTTFDNDDDKTARKTLWLGLGFVQAFIPLWDIPSDWPPMDGPQWGFALSREFGIVLRWRFWRQSWDWPWSLHTLAYEQQLPDGSWRSVFDRTAEPHTECAPYAYRLRSGEVQHRTATVSKRRHVLCRRAFKRFGWPRWTKESIDVDFDGEVGERTGSWKGGTTGCGYDLAPGETLLDALRRMERERKFDR